MKQDEILFMAMKSGCPKENALVNMDILQDFAKLVADVATAKEREACAAICKKQADVYGMLEPTPAFQAAWAACIDNRDRILARGDA